MDREQLESSSFNYLLPEERIAKYPLVNRNESKLLLYQSGTIQESIFSSLEEHLPKGATLVFNDTKVLAARLHFKNKNGAKIEIFCLEPYQSTTEETLNTTSQCIWSCLVGNLKRFKKSEDLSLGIAGATLKASLMEKREQDVLVQFSWSENISFSEIIQEAGEIPLPPYLNRSTEPQDKDNYQTVYAKTEGAVAAPTAGLHFTDTQLNKIKQSGHKLAYLTLHVGAGTFRPVKSSKLVEHNMHQERIVISKQTIEQLVNQNSKLISVGTTSLRSLESLYWLALKTKMNNTNQLPNIDQEDAYHLNSNWNWNEAFTFLLKWMNTHNKQTLDFHSSLFIMPGYEWKVINGLITNFHQPKSTLLALVASWIGEDWKMVYEYALENDFRFLSFGDSSLLLKN